jgi:hypothetical protein
MAPQAYQVLSLVRFLLPKTQELLKHFIIQMSGLAHVVSEAELTLSDHQQGPAGEQGLHS